MKVVNKFIVITINIIINEKMILLLAFAPLLLAIVLKFGCIFITPILLNHLSFDLINYYPYIDIFIFYMSGLIYGMVISFLIIDEIDDGIVNYYKITPLGGKTYLLGRFLIPLCFLLIIFIIISLFFTINQYNILILSLIWLFAICQMYLSGMLVIALAGNKLEALVVSKLIGLQIIPYMITIFEKSDYRYLFAFMPSLFLGSAVENINSSDFYLFLSLSILLTIAYLIFLYSIFIKKLYKSAN